MFRQLICLLMLSGCWAAHAQYPAPYKEERSVLYRNEASGALFIHSTGWGLQARRGKNITDAKKRIYEIDITSLKHPKEYSISPQIDNGQSFVYGKQRGFLLLRTGMGFQNVIFDKGERGGVQIRYLYCGGLDIGITKPIYYQVSPGISNTTIPFNPSLTETNILGTGSFFKGFGALGFSPGIYGKGGFSFEYGSSYQSLTAIEVGAIVDVFLQPVPIMAVVPNKSIFLGFYIELLYGKKW